MAPAALPYSPGKDTYTGNTEVIAGTLQLAGASSLPSSTQVTLSGGTLDLDGHGFTINQSTTGGALVNSSDSCLPVHRIGNCI